MKLAIIIDRDLPVGLAANSAAVLGISIGARFPGIVREAVYDSDGREHAGITSLAIPVLAAESAILAGIVRSAAEAEDIEVIPFNRVAQGCHDYDEYKIELAKVCGDGISYSGAALAGSRKAVQRFTGSLPLLR